MRTKFITGASKVKLNSDQNRAIILSDDPGYGVEECYNPSCGKIAPCNIDRQLIFINWTTPKEFK
jgi:hypothetical protein